MSTNFRFAIISDPHVAIPQTIRGTANRFHLVEVSIPALELVLEHLETFNLDFLLIPGDLTQDGEPENHQWLQQRLACLPFPAYVIPGNHDVPTLFPFMMKLLTTHPLNLEIEEAEKLVPQLRYFWADIAAGDAMFDFVDFPPLVRRYFQYFSAINGDGSPNLIDNHAKLIL